MALRETKAEGADANMDSDCDVPYDYESEQDNESPYDDGDEDMYQDDLEEKEARGGTSSKNNYTVMNEDDVRRRQEELITTVSGVLSVSRVSASILLTYFNWSVSNLNDAWFADEHKVRTTVGIIENQNPNATKSPPTCLICFEDYSWSPNSMHGIGCGHSYCGLCWQGYITSSINSDGVGCLNLRCPHPSCSAAVGQNLVTKLVGREEEEKYAHYLLRSYVEANRTTKWCPAPGCNYAIEFQLGSGSYNVTCNCTHTFCWNCTEEVHTPVDCSTVAKWILKNNSESENVTWLLANSKPCPKCKRPIEKNHGCMHMTCSRPCGFEFCWLCLGSWAEHGNHTGGNGACNGYAVAKREGKLDEAERKREMAKRAIDRYTHFYERWAANHSSRQKAIEDLKKLHDVDMKTLGTVQDLSEIELEFLTKAWLQIIECRRVLKWTYAYGFYLAENERSKRRLFEYLQGEAESGLERLHQCIEKDMKDYLTVKCSSQNFIEFRTKLIDLTNITRNFFDNLVQALENGLSDVVAEADDGSWFCMDCTYLNEEDDKKCRVCKRPKASWSCEHCTSVNVETATTCRMCEQPR